MRYRRYARQFLLTLAAAAVLGAPAHLAAQAATVTVTDPWMRFPLPAAKNTAVFLVLENHSAAARQLVSASTPVAGKTELHTMSMEGGMMRMSPVKSVSIPANGNAELKPGSLHIMLFDLKEHPAEGTTIPLTLTLDNGEKLDVRATVRKPEGMR